MASIPIHKDMFNFERKRAGFTPRQLKALVEAVVVAVAIVALLAYGVGLPVLVGVCAGVVCASPFIVSGFLPINGLAADEYVQRLLDNNRRGNSIVWCGESVAPLEGEVSRAYRKKAKARRFERTVHAAIGAE